MEQITGIGLPFPPDYSSCSNLPPKLFKWTSGPSTIKIYIDGAIDQGLLDRATPTKFGWLCESRDICDDQYRKIKSNIDKKYSKVTCFYQKLIFIFQFLIFIFNF